MSKIKTYDDLLQEEEKLLAQLKLGEAKLKTDIAGVRQRLEPLGRVMKMVNKFTTRDKTGGLSTFGLDFSIDLLVRRVLLAKAGWFTKILVPYLIKNYGSHIISEKQRASLFTKINAVLSKIRPKRNVQDNYN